LLTEAKNDLVFTAHVRIVEHWKIAGYSLKNYVRFIAIEIGRNYTGTHDEKLNLYATEIDRRAFAHPVALRKLFVINLDFVVTDRRAKFNTVGICHLIARKRSGSRLLQTKCLSKHFCFSKRRDTK